MQETKINAVKFSMLETGIPMTEIAAFQEMSEILVPTGMHVKQQKNL